MEEEKQEELQEIAEETVAAQEAAIETAEAPLEEFTEEADEQKAVSTIRQKVVKLPIFVSSTIDQKAERTLAMRSAVVRWPIFAILTVIFVATGATLWGTLFDPLVGIVLFATGLVIPSLAFFINIFIIHRRYSKQAIAPTRVVRFEFGAKIVAREDIGNNKEAQSDYEWNEVSKAHEVKDYFFLYLGIGTALVAEKKGVESASLMEFRGLLEYKLGKKYKGKIVE